jgi:organic radical activating enzyme
MGELNRKKMYRLPWSKNDNPNGWLELTTYCQLNCPGCYRGLFNKNAKRFHEKLDELKKQVDFLIKTRNVQTISLSGGEPLLYPYLDDLVRYIASKRLRIKIYTNGIKLDEERLIKLRDLGVTEFIIHIDKNQKRKGYSSEGELNKLRRHYCNLFRRVERINLGFIMPISKDNYSEIDVLLNFYKSNSDIINLIVFTCYNGQINDQDPNKKISIEDISKKINEVYHCNPTAYLGKIHTKEKISWLFFFPLIHNSKAIGEIGKDVYEKVQSRYHKKHGRYFITIKGNKLKPIHLFGLFDLSKALQLFFKSIFNPVRNQVILIIDSPEKNEFGWELCESCPDAMVYENKLVPSCLLERIKKGEKISI